MRVSALAAVGPAGDDDRAPQGAALSLETYAGHDIEHIAGGALAGSDPRRSVEPVRSFDPEALRRIRWRRGMSHDALAAVVEVARPNLIAYEQGTKRPGVEILGALARALGVDPWALTTARARTATVADLRARAGITKTDLARRLGIARSTWDLIERGDRQLRPELAVVVAELLAVDERGLRQALRRGVDAEELRRSGRT